MRKFNKNFKTKRMTVESMLTCAQKCKTGCNCSACGNNIAASQGIVNMPSYEAGAIDYELIAYGSAIG